jgi:hypothetical protein
MSKVKDAVSRNNTKNEMDEMGEQFAEEFEEEDAGEFDDDFDDGGFEESEVYEWENPYRFAEEMLEPDGFADMSDFVTKVMFFECQRSPRYRDRIQHGAETIATVSKSVESIRAVKGGGDKTDYEEVADKLQNMDRAIRSAESLSGKEDMIIQEGMGIANDLVQAFGQRRAGGGASVDSSVTERDGEL